MLDGAAQQDLHFGVLCDVVRAALDDAGMARDGPHRFGVFTSAQTSDFVEPMATYMVARAVAGTLRTQGPYDNTEAVCSSGYLAVHKAACGIAGGMCNSAVAGGVSLMLRPEWGIEILLGGILSLSGSMRPFDAKADGMVWGEGAAAVVLSNNIDANQCGADYAGLMGW